MCANKTAATTKSRAKPTWQNWLFVLNINCKIPSETKPEIAEVIRSDFLLKSVTVYVKNVKPTKKGINHVRFFTLKPKTNTKPKNKTAPMIMA